MGPTTAVLTSTIVITGISVIKDVSQAKDPIPPVITGFMLGMALIVVSFVSGPLAKALAYMGVAGAVLTNGTTLMATVGKVGA